MVKRRQKAFAPSPPPMNKPFEYNYSEGTNGGGNRGDASTGNGGNGNHVNINNDSANGEISPMMLAERTISTMGFTVTNRVEEVGKSLSSSLFKSICITCLLTTVLSLSVGALLFHKIDRFEIIFYESASAQIKLLKEINAGNPNAVQGQ